MKPGAFFAKLFPKPAAETVDWDMSPRDWVAILTAAFGAFMALLDIQVTNSSLREIQGSLGIDMSESGWISTAYLIAEIMVIPLAPVLTETLGLGRYLICGSVLFAATSALCATAWNLESLATFRFLQGLAGGTLIPLILQMILVQMPAHRRAVGLALFGLVATLAPSIGPSVGGILSMNFGWRSVFLVNLLPSMAVVWLVRKSFPPSFTSWRVLREADWVGAALLCSSVGAMTFALEEGSNRGWFQDGLVGSCIAVAAVGLPAFVAWERRQLRPLLHLDLFADRAFTVSTLITFLAAQCLYGGMYGLSIFLGGIRGYSPREIGAVLAWGGIPQIFVIAWLPWLMRRFDPRLLAVAGLIFFSFSNLLNTGLNEDYSQADLRWSLIVRALSQPFFTIPLSALAIQKITPSRGGAASSVVNMVRNLGGSVGIAIVAGIMTTRVDNYAAHLSEGFSPGSPEMLALSQAVKYGLWFIGQDPTATDAVTAMALHSKILREAYFHCFIQVFSILFIELLVAAALTLLIPFDRKAMESRGPAGAH